MLPFGIGILAGGKSRRMGQNKALLHYGGETMLEHIVRELSDGEMLISAAEPGTYERFGCRVVLDENRDIGPIEGIRRLLTESEHDWMFLCAVDMPLLRREVAEYVGEFLSSDYDCCIMTSGGRVHPLCGAYAKSVAPVIEEQIAAGQYKLSEVLHRVRTKYVPLEYTRFDDRVLENVNTPQEYAHLFAPRIFCVCGHKNSGKTTLICRLIEAFRRDGYAVAAIKHDGHDCFSDVAESDTARFSEAGAECSAIFTDTRYAFTAHGKLEPEALIDWFRRMPEPPDILIAEGLKASEYPKIELMHGSGEKSVCSGTSPMFFVTEEIPSGDLISRAFQRDDVEGIYAQLRRELGMEADMAEKRTAF